MLLHISWTFQLFKALRQSKNAWLKWISSPSWPSKEDHTISVAWCTLSRWKIPASHSPHNLHLPNYFWTFLVEKAWSHPVWKIYKKNIILGKTRWDDIHVNFVTDLLSYDMSSGNKSVPQGRANQTEFWDLKMSL